MIWGDNMMTGYCNRCNKIWTLESVQGHCQWCHKPSHCISARRPAEKPRKSRKDFTTVPLDYADLSGEWLDWLNIARHYEVKIPTQDRPDLRHDIIIELHRARERDGVAIPRPRAYRIASLMVALYWRKYNRTSIRVCIYDGMAKEPHCKDCKRKPAKSRCIYLAWRPVQSLYNEAMDIDGNETALLDTVADDTALDLDAWLDAKAWLNGCPTRLVDIATKRVNGVTLSDTDQRYFTRQRLIELQRLQQPLF